MRGILRSCWIVSPLSLVLRVLYLALIVFLVVSSQATFHTLFAAMFMGFLVLINPATLQMRKYFRVMPIKLSTILLMEYLHNLVALAFGAGIAVAGVFIFSDNVVVSINFVLFLIGLILTTLGLGGIVGALLRQKYWYLSLLMYVVALAPLYLIFGVDTIHGLVRGRIDGVYITSSPIFTDTASWLAFVALGLAVYVVSYFVATALYKKKDYEKPVAWWV